MNLGSLLKLDSLWDIPHFASLRHSDYRNTWMANVFSGAAMWTFLVASSWLVFEDSDSSGWVGIITFSSMLPFLLVSPIGGLMADRFDRRRMAFVAFVLSCINISMLAVLTIAGVVQLWHVAVLAFIGGMLRAAQEPAIQSLIPNQVPLENLLNAITLNSASRHGARLLLLVASPLLAIDFIGVKGVLVLSTVFQAFGAVQMARVKTVSFGKLEPEHGLTRNMLEGLVYIYSNRVIGLFVILVFFHCALTMSFDSILPALSEEELGASDGSILGYLVMGFGAGALLGTMTIAGVRDDRCKGQLLIWTGFASGMTPIFLAFSINVPMAVVASVGMGVSQATFMAITYTYVQSIAPDRLRGRIASLYTLHAGGIMAFTNLGYGFIADSFSAPPILLVTGLMFIAVLVGLSVTESTLRMVYRTGQVVRV